MNTDAQSYLSRSPSDVLAKVEEEKKAKYLSACEARRALFTPICVSVDGMVHRRLQTRASPGFARVEIFNRKHDVILISSY